MSLESGSARRSQRRVRRVRPAPRPAGRDQVSPHRCRRCARLGRFEREGGIAARFNHPHAVTVYDVGDAGTRPYIVMELVEGPSVAQMLAQRGRLEPDEAVAIADEVLDALGAATTQGLVHRDVKPANILLTREQVAKLADFGIAKAVADTTGGVTMTGELMGTPRYLSPEQVGGHPTTRAPICMPSAWCSTRCSQERRRSAARRRSRPRLAHQHEPLPSLASRRPGLDSRLVAAVETRRPRRIRRAVSPMPGEMRRALAPSSADATVSRSVGVPADAATLADGAMLAGARRTQVLRAPASRGPARKRRAVGPGAWTIGGLALLAVVFGIFGAVALSKSGGNNLASTRAPTATEAPTTGRLRRRRPPRRPRHHARR